jgi:hypothetical protein
MVKLCLPSVSGILVYVLDYDDGIECLYTAHFLTFNYCVYSNVTRSDKHIHFGDVISVLRLISIWMVENRCIQISSFIRYVWIEIKVSFFNFTWHRMSYLIFIICLIKI